MVLLSAIGYAHVILNQIDACKESVEGAVGDSVAFKPFLTCQVGLLEMLNPYD